METQKSAAVALIELLGSAFWPVVVLCAVLIFRPYVASFLEAASAEVKNAATIKVGSIDITLSQTSLPKAPLNVSKVLPDLDGELIDYILANRPEVNYSQCYLEQFPNDLSPDGTITRLKKLNFLSFEAIENEKDVDGKPCVRAILIKFSSLSSQVRTYYIDILKGLKFETPKG